MGEAKALMSWFVARRWRTRVAAGLVLAIGIGGVSLGAAQAGTEHAFIRTGSDGPMRWLPCNPIRWKVAGAPAGEIARMQEAFANVAQRTGLRFVYAGESNLSFDATWIGNSSAPLSTYKSIQAEVLVSFVPTSVMQGSGYGDALGFAGGRGQFLDDILRSNRYGTGIVVIDRDEMQKTVTLPGYYTAGYWVPGFYVGSRYVYGYYVPGVYVPPVTVAKYGDADKMYLYLHELGHLVGLAHVSDPSSVMVARGSLKGSWSEGDLIGLKAVGPQLRCADLPQAQVVAGANSVTVNLAGNSDYGHKIELTDGVSRTVLAEVPAGVASVKLGPEVAMPSVDRNKPYALWVTAGPGEYGAALLTGQLSAEAKTGLASSKCNLSSCAVGLNWVVSGVAPVVAEGLRVAIERETKVVPKKKSGKDDDKAVAKGAKDAGRVTWVELGAVPVDPATGSYTLQVGHDVAGNFKYRTVLIGVDGSRQVFGEPIAVNVAKAGG